jgi:tripartite ATP-independent transporter DctM subunit
LAQIDVARLLIAGVLPGVLMGFLCLSYIMSACLINPGLAPAYHVPHTPFWQKMAVTMRDFVPLGFIVFMVIGVIFLGIATPTEAAATGTLGAFVLALVYGRINRQVMKSSVYGTVRVTVMIFMIIVVSTTYSEILAFTGAARGLVEFVVSQQVHPIIIMITMMLSVLILGCFMETVSIMMITLPIFMPIVEAFGFNPIWFGVLMLVNLEMGMLTPPFGMLCFVTKGISPPDISMSDIWKAVIPFVLVYVAGIAILMAVPEISLVLPNLMGMK